MSRETAQTINRFKGYWFWPVIFIIVSLSVLVSFVFGAEVTGSYGSQFYNYLITSLGRSACFVGAIGLILTSLRSLSGKSQIKPYISWFSFGMMMFCVSVLERLILGEGISGGAFNGGVIGELVGRELTLSLGVMGSVITLAMFALSLVAWVGESAERFIFQGSEALRNSSEKLIKGFFEKIRNHFVQFKQQREEKKEALREMMAATEAEAAVVAEAEKIIAEEEVEEEEEPPEEKKKPRAKKSRTVKRKEEPEVEAKEEKKLPKEEEPQFQSKPVDIEAMVREAIEKKMKVGKKEKPAKEKLEESEVTLEVEQPTPSEEPVDSTPLPEESGMTLANKPAAQLSLNHRKKKKKKAKVPQVSSKPGEYELPSLDLLLPAEEEETEVEELKEINERAQALQVALKNFGLDVQVVGIQQGPVITQYELELAPGIKVARVMNLQNDIAMALRARSVRILAPIPGKATVGVEVPNKSRKSVGLRELIEAGLSETKKMSLPSFIGRDIFGEPVVYDVTAMPHLMMAGATGAGKSVGINCLVLSILLTRSPDECKLVLVDPKQVELSFYRGIPHLISPVVTDMKKVPSILDWAVRKMEERYDLLARVGVRDIGSFNKMGEKKIKENLGIKEEDEAVVDTYMPRIVVIIDELADLMMLSTSSKDVEANIQRLAQKSRAIGIHVVLATQRPSVDVITGVIKANLPCRIAYMVNSATDSRTILDRKGAEALLGRGDLLFKDPSRSDMQRLQGAFVSEDEVRDIVNHWKKQGDPNYIEDLVNSHKISEDNTNKDELYDKAVKLVLESQRGSTTFLQRLLGVGYTRASRLIEMMESEGLLGPHRGSVSREIMCTWEEYQAQLQALDEELEADELEENDDSDDSEESESETCQEEENQP